MTHRPTLSEILRSITVADLMNEQDYVLQQLEAAAKAMEPAPRAPDVQVVYIYPDVVNDRIEQLKRRLSEIEKRYDAEAAPIADELVRLMSCPTIVECFLPRPNGETKP